MADLVPGKAEAFAERFELENVRCYSSDEELIANEKDIDGVSICTYNYRHVSCVIHALDAGINVMLEKPFTVRSKLVHFPRLGGQLHLYSINISLKQQTDSVFQVGGG